MKNWLKRTRYFFLILAIVVALPYPSSFSGGLLWFSPYLFLHTLLASGTFVWFNLIGLGFLILMVFKRRIICKYTCPLGVVCDQVSRLGVQKKKLVLFRNFHKPLALFALGFAVFGLPVFVILDPFYIFQTSLEPIRSGFHWANVIKLIPLLGIIAVNLLYPGSWCSSLCPLGGLQVLAADLKNTVFRKRDVSTAREFPSAGSRRLFISSLAGLSAGVLAAPLMKRAGNKDQIRPPSSLPEQEYLLNCIRCGNCIGACPTDIITQQTNADLLSFLAPAVDFSESYCLTECTRCGEVCPSGALARFSLHDKKSLVMATVHVDYEHCLLYNQKECNQCKLYCDYDAVSYQIPPGLMNPVPVFDKDRCVGCAACKIVCPANVIHLDVPG